MTRVGNVVALAVGVALLLSACSGSDAAPATTVVSTSAATTTEPPTTTSTTTTEAPTTTVDPAIALAAEVEADVLEAFALLHVGLQDPTNESKKAAAIDAFVGPNREFIAQRFDDFVRNGWALRPSPDVEAAVLVEIPAALIEPSTDVAELQVCEIDSWITVEVGAGPNRSDAIVNPDLTILRSVYFVRRVDNRWKPEGSDRIGEWTGLETCPPD